MMTMGSTLPAASASAPAPLRIVRRLGADTRYVLAGFPLAVAGFVVAVTGFSLGVGLLAVTLGLPVLAAALYAARGFADVERLQLGVLTGRRVTRPEYPRSTSRNPYRKAWSQLRHGQGWLDLLHAFVTFVASIVAFVLTVTWWAAAAGGLTYWFWERFLPENGNDVVVTAVLGSYSHAGEIALFTAAGVFALVTLPLVARGMAGMRAGIASLLLVDLAKYKSEVAR